jgi:hypothetical protein
MGHIVRVVPFVPVEVWSFVIKCSMSPYLLDFPVCHPSMWSPMKYSDVEYYRDGESPGLCHHHPSITRNKTYAVQSVTDQPRDAWKRSPRKPHAFSRWLSKTFGKQTASFRESTSLRSDNTPRYFDSMTNHSSPSISLGE